jgi:hypothetical protein
MKVKTGTILRRLNGRPLLVDQEPAMDVNGQPVSINGTPLMTGGREMTVGDVISSILTTRKQDQFNTLKAYALAQRFYRAEAADLDDTDYPALREVVERNDQFIPLVIAQVLQVLMDAREGKAKEKGNEKA